MHSYGALYKKELLEEEYLFGRSTRKIKYTGDILPV